MKKAKGINKNVATKIPLKEYNNIFSYYKYNYQQKLLNRNL